MTRAQPAQFSNKGLAQGNRKFNEQISFQKYYLNLPSIKSEKLLSCQDRASTWRKK